MLEVNCRFLKWNWYLHHRELTTAQMTARRRGTHQRPTKRVRHAAEEHRQHRLVGDGCLTASAIAKDSRTQEAWKGWQHSLNVHICTVTYMIRVTMYFKPGSYQTFF